MAHFAYVVDGIVQEVIVAEREYIDTLPNLTQWIQTSYNTREGVHYGEDGQPDGKSALRKNFAGIGYEYRADLDAFIPPNPYPSWILNEDKCIYEAPVPVPNDGRPYKWDEDTVSWLLNEEGV